MAGIWGRAEDGRWRVVEPDGYPSEAALHDLVRATPNLLPLTSNPPLVVLGSEVPCGRERADLLAVEVDSGRLVIIEIKLASNTDRRQALTQLLGYASYLRRLSMVDIEQLLARSVSDIVRESVQDPDLELEVFEEALASSQSAGLLHCVLVLDAAPPELVALVSYVQDVTNDQLLLDLVTVSSYRVGDQTVVVPELVQAGDFIHTAAPQRPGSSANASTITKGWEVFATAISEAPDTAQGELRHLLAWARQLEADGLAVLYTSTGKDRWVLNPRLPGSERGLLVIYNDHGASINTWRTVWESQAPEALQAVETQLGPLGQGRSLGDRSDTTLGLLRAGYAEAAIGKRQPPAPPGSA